MFATESSEEQKKSSSIRNEDEYDSPIATMNKRSPQKDVKFVPQQETIVQRPEGGRLPTDQSEELIPKGESIAEREELNKKTESDKNYLSPRDEEFQQFHHQMEARHDFDEGHHTGDSHDEIERQRSGYKLNVKEASERSGDMRVDRKYSNISHSEDWDSDDDNKRVSFNEESKSNNQQKSKEERKKTEPKEETKRPVKTIENIPEKPTNEPEKPVKESTKSSIEVKKSSKASVKTDSKKSNSPPITKSSNKPPVGNSDDLQKAPEESKIPHFQEADNLNHEFDNDDEEADSDGTARGFGGSHKGHKSPEAENRPFPEKPRSTLDQQPKEEEKPLEDENDDAQSSRSFGRQDGGHYIEVTNQDQDILDFKRAMDLKYQNFRRTVLEKYQAIRLDYLKKMDFAIRENERENNSSIDYIEQQLEYAINEKDAAIKRATQSRIILANIMREKYNTFHLKKVCFKALKYFYEWRKYEDAKTKFSCNYYRKKLLQKLLNGWRKISHEQFLVKAFKVRDEYELQQRVPIFNIDNKIENLMLYLSQLQVKIEEETGLILEIPEEYQINTGLYRIKEETDKLRETDLFEEVRLTQTEAIYKTIAN